MKLTIDTTNNLQTVIKLNDLTFRYTYESPRQQDVFGAFKQSLSKAKIELRDLTEIEVAVGPGSFTSLRTGIAIANALSFSLQIPINKQPPGTVIKPEYGRPPSITQPKKR